MMMTAGITNNQNKTMTDEATAKPSTPYDLGAGHLNLDRAMDPGLVYDITGEDYVRFLCSVGYGPREIQVITRSPPKCPGKKTSPGNLNYPSIATVFPTSAAGVSSKTFIRTVTNVGQANAVYRLKIEAPRGVKVMVKPSNLIFTEAVKKRSYLVTVAVDRSNLMLGESGGVFGSLYWSDGKQVVNRRLRKSLKQNLKLLEHVE